MPSHSPLTREMSPARLKVLVRACGQFDCFSAGANLNDVVCISKVMFFHSLADEDVHLSLRLVLIASRDSTGQPLQPQLMGFVSHAAFDVQAFCCESSKMLSSRIQSIFLFLVILPQ